MRRRPARLLVVGSVLLASLFALVVNLLTNTVDLPAEASWVMVPAAVVLAAAMAWIEVARSRSAVDVAIDAVTADLAARVWQIWAAEAVTREIRPVPVRLAWSSTHHPAASREAVFGDRPDFPLCGEMDELKRQFVTLYRNLPRRQLLVLGCGGGGKTAFAMLLMLGLIEDPMAGEPVPLLFAINEWDPAESVATFVARRLAEDYGDLLAEYGEPESLAKMLVERRRILPILDGLDELSDRGQALRALNAYADAGQPLVLTCRSWEYGRLVQEEQNYLKRTAAIELQPVTVEAATEYLSSPEPARERWEPVFAHLRRFPSHPLARALVKPLMVSLARIAYEKPRTDPAELLAQPSLEAVDCKLMDVFVVASFSARRLATPMGTTRCYDPEKARKWLSYLAFHLYTAGTRNLHEGQLEPGLLSARPRLERVAVRATAVMLAAAAAGVAGAVAGFGVLWPAVAGGLVMAAAAGGCLRGLWQRDTPAEERRLVRAVRGITAGLGCAVLTALITDADRSPAWLLAGFVCGGIALVTQWPGSDPELTGNRRAAFAATSGNALLGGLVFLAVVPAHPVTGAVAAVVYGGTAGLAAGGWDWTWFRLTHGRLVLGGWLPMRLSRFLRDAHRMGLLRRDGVAHQFRHAFLQDHLLHLPRAVHTRNRYRAGESSEADTLAELIAEHGDRLPEIAALRPQRRFLHGRHEVDYYQHQERLVAVRMAERRRVDAEIDNLRFQADAGDQSAARHLAGLLAGHGRTIELQAQVSAGNSFAPQALADLYANQGRLRDLEAMENAGDDYAGRRLNELLAARDKRSVLRARADAGNNHALEHLIRLEHTDDSVEVLRFETASGNRGAALKLAARLAGQGKATEALKILRAPADEGDGFAARQLNDLLVKLKRYDELRARSRAGDRDARRLVDDLRIEQHYRVPLKRAAAEREMAELRTRVAAGFNSELPRLARLLADEGRIAEACSIIQPAADAGVSEAVLMRAHLLHRLDRPGEAIALLRPLPDVRAARLLVDLLFEQKLTDELRRMARKDEYAAQWLAQMLAEAGEVDELRELARKRNGFAARQLVKVLVARVDLDELHHLAAGGDRYAARCLMNLLIDGERVDLLCAWAGVFPQDIARPLVDTLAAHGKAESLEKLAREGNSYAARKLPEVLVERGSFESAKVMLRRQAELGDDAAASALVELLADLGLHDEATAFLRPRADAGDEVAKRRLAGLLEERLR